MFAFLSDNQVDPDVAIESFLLAPKSEGDGNDPADGVEDGNDAADGVEDDVVAPAES